MPLTVTFDLEDNRSSATQEPRYVAMSHRFLDFLRERGIRGTFFVVGELAESQPRARAAGGGGGPRDRAARPASRPARRVGPGRLRGELEEGRELLEDVAGVPVRGFRAPIFSLTPGTAWAIEEIAEAGFAYSSSVLPGREPPARMARGSPPALSLAQRPARAALPGGRRRKVSGPVPGGHLHALLPARAVAPDAAAGSTGRTTLWSYVHPYDIDTDEPFFVMPHAGWLVSRIVHTRRRCDTAAARRDARGLRGPGQAAGRARRRARARELHRIDPRREPSVPRRGRGAGEPVSDHGAAFARSAERCSRKCFPAARWRASSICAGCTSSRRSGP